MGLTISGLIERPECLLRWLAGAYEQGSCWFAGRDGRPIRKPRGGIFLNHLMFFRACPLKDNLRLFLPHAE